MKTEKDYEKEADELIERFRIKVTIDTVMDSIPTRLRDKMNIESAKQCVLICVDEEIRLLKKLGSSGKFDLVAKYLLDELEEYEKIKQAIEKK